MSRREMLARLGGTGLAASGLGAFLAACGGSGSGGTQATAGGSQSCHDLKALTWQGYAEPQWIKPFKAKYGTAVTPTYISTADQQIAKFAAGGKGLYDVTNVSTDNKRELLGLKVIKPLNAGQVQNWSDLIPSLRQSETVNGEVWSVPWTWDVNPFLYNSRYLKTKPTSWEILWDPSLKGKIGIWNDLSTLWIVANVLGMDEPASRLDNLSSDDLSRISKKLNELKPNVRVVWSDPGDLMNLMESGEVVASLGWSFIYNELKPKHPEIERAVFKNHGANAWTDSWAIPVEQGGGSGCGPRAMDFINWVTTPEMMATIAVVTGYSPANAAAAKHLTKKQLDSTLLPHAADFLKRTKFKADPTNRAACQQVLNEFMSAVG